jgi:TonB-linked SusC/RagA family outer membrane protein
MKKIYKKEKSWLNSLWIFVCWLVFSSTAFAQTKTITGNVKDTKGDAVPGVAISVKGTPTKGTTTDGNGKFSLAGVDSKTVLRISSIGFETQEVNVGNKSVLEINLAENAASLEEVVVVGYGVQKKVNMTGAVSTVDSKMIENRPTTSLQTALQGTSPGLIVTRTNGQPGNEGLGIQIRGATTANGSVDPLIILDGVTVPSITLQTMNQNDIESISILKDAAAAAIYGAQAAGGVILITSKKGKNGKVTFDYSGMSGADWAANIPERMTLLEEANFSNLARKNSGSGPEYSDFDLEQIKNNVPYLVNPADTTQWLFYNQDPLSQQILKNYTSMQMHNLSARGGTDKLNFLISGGYYNKKGLFKVGPDQLTRYNLRINLGAKLSNNLSLDSRVAYTNELTEQSSRTASGQGLIYDIYRLRTRTPFFTPLGQYNGAGSGATTYANLAEGGYNNLSRNFFDGTFTFKLENLVKGLTLRTIAGTQYRRGDRYIFNRTVPLWGRFGVNRYVNQVNSYSISNDVTKNLNLQFLANYDLKINKHTFGALLGYQWEDFRYVNTTSGATNMVSNDLPTLNLGDDKTKTNSESIATYAFQSVFGRFNYNFDDKYLLEGTLRQDESSKLAQDGRTKIFPSVSAGWNVHREAWISESLQFISEFKLRGSWGRLGGALGSTLGYYDYVNQLTRGSALVLGDSRTSYIYQGSLPSTNLSWETIETTNGGFDIGLMKNKLQVSGDYYVKSNKNMLTPQQLPATIGIATPRKNNGELKSWGWELEVKYRGKIGDKFSYNIGGNFSDNQNELVSFSNRIVVARGNNSLIEGYPINTIWGYQTAGYFSTADEVKASAFQDNRTGAGDIKYVDQNGDKQITVGKGTKADYGDLILLGNTSPRYLFGFNLGFDYQGFDFSAFVQGVGQRTFLAGSESVGPLLVTWKQAMGIHRDYWTPENPNALFPRPYVGATHNFGTSDKWAFNGQYARLKNIQLGYTIPSVLTKKMGISKARVYVSGQDIITVSAMGKFGTLFDPESANNADNDYPYFSTASVGLNLSF